jgi:hypothetical protein
MMDLVKIVQEFLCVQGIWIYIHLMVCPVLVVSVVADVRDALLNTDVDDDMVEQYRM